jgi:hypothetical protein
MRNGLISAEAAQTLMGAKSVEAARAPTAMEKAPGDSRAGRYR